MSCQKHCSINDNFPEVGNCLTSTKRHSAFLIPPFPSDVSQINSRGKNGNKHIDRMLEMTLDGPTNAGYNVTSTIACALSQNNTQKIQLKRLAQ